VNVVRPATMRDLHKGCVGLLTEEDTFPYFVSARKSVEEKCVATIVGCSVESNKIF
jgi:hypothetical protein